LKTSTYFLITEASSSAAKRQKGLRSTSSSIIPPGSKIPPVIRISKRESPYLRYSRVLPSISSLEEIASRSPPLTVFN
jgi:hypothetical protein